MKIKMLEYFQGTNLPSLILGVEYDVDEIGRDLTDWLLEHRKAEKVMEPVKVIKKVEVIKQDEPELEKKPATRARSKRGSANK